MKALSFIILLLTLAIISSAWPQNLQVISTSPTDGAVDVAMEASIHFTFNMPMDTTADFGEDNLPSGIYFYRLRTDSFQQTKRLILVRKK